MTEASIISPVDGSVYRTLELLPAGTAEACLATARTAQLAWAATPLQERMGTVGKIVPALDFMAGDIAVELAWQMGRPVRHGPQEIAGVAERTYAMIDAAPDGLAPKRFDIRTGRKFIDREPHGVALVIAPWNYPYLTAINTVVPALLAGNAVILKPAMQTALTGERLAAACAQAGLPDGLFQSLPVDHAVIADWIGKRSVDFVSFTGSVRGGSQMEVAAAGTFLPLSLELGGKDPAYVRRDADIAQAAEGLVDGSFYNSGQSCCGVERIYVDRAVYADFLAAFEERMSATQKLGDPTHEATTLGPVISASAAQSIREQMDAALHAGARLLGSGSGEDDGPYIAASALFDVDHSMPLMMEETFGPVVGIMPVDDDDGALALMNDSRYGLTASIWTKDAETGLSLARQVRTGTAFLNRCDYLDPQLAWVGVLESGRGCSLSELGFHQVTRPKSYNFVGAA